MSALKSFLKFGIVFAILIVLGWGFVAFYPYIFSRRVVGVIEKVERVNLNVSLLQTAGNGQEKLNPELYSFAVAIREPSGEIVTASAQDRQWSVAEPGKCAEAVFYPYPPWQLEKASTYYNARLEKLSVCPTTSP